MPIVNGIWVPNLSPKQMLVFNATERVILVSGPRWSSKTWATVHKVIRHMWETPGARVALFSKTIKNAKDGGVWEDLVTYGMTEWLEANLEGARPDITFEYTVEPKIDGMTRTMGFRIRNFYGTESELKLFSLDYDAEVSAKVKGTRFSMFWFSELTNFDDRAVLATTLQQLRMPHLKPEQHQWIADTNPSDDGEESIWYKIWYGERTMQGVPDYADTPAKIADFRKFQSKLRLIEIMLDDNPFIDEEKKAEIRQDHAYDPELYARNVEGRWIGGAGKNRLFSDLYKQNVHKLGDASMPNEDDWEIALPSADCFELICGWDLGDTNHAAHIMQKIMIGEEPHWVILDELVITKTETSIENFTLQFMEKMKFMESCVQSLSGTKRRVIWKHYADESVNRYRSAVDDYDRNIVLNVSKGTIFLEGVPKPSGSVLARVHLLRRFLYEKRIRFSAHCFATEEMLRRAKKGANKSEPVNNDIHKHPFDSLTYALLMESAYDAARFESGSRSYKRSDIEIRL